jgi:glycosyltransferase involved in cell wall biosynthesis
MRLVRLPTWRSKHLESLIHSALSTVHAMCKHYDIVHYHALGPALFSFFPRLLGSKTAVTVQGLDWQRKKWAAFASHVLRLGERASARLPNSTMVVSQTLREHYRTHFGAEPTYIPNGAVLRKPREPRLLKQWGLEAENYVLFLGRFSPEKNCLLLVDAFEKLETDAKLVLAGGFGYDDAYARALKRHESDRVRFLDYVCGDALDELLTNAKLFVLPSDMEGLSLALLEAMGAGRCVLASDIPENCELVDGVGFTFRRGDVLDLERMLRLLLADPEVRERSGQSARQRIAELYNWDVITRQIEAEYFRTLGLEPPRLDDSAPLSREAMLTGQRHKN